MTVATVHCQGGPLGDGVAYSSIGTAGRLRQRLNVSVIAITGKGTWLCPRIRNFKGMFLDETQQSALSNVDISFWNCTSNFDVSPLLKSVFGVSLYRFWQMLERAVSGSCGYYDGHIMILLCYIDASLIILSVVVALPASSYA